MPVLFTGLLTMAVAQLFDLGTFVAMVRRLGPGAETNPLVTDLLGAYGFPMVALAKVALVVLVAAITIILRQRTRRLERSLGAVVLGVAIVAGLIGGGVNSLTIATF